MSLIKRRQSVATLKDASRNQKANFSDWLAAALECGSADLYYECRAPATGQADQIVTGNGGASRDLIGSVIRNGDGLADPMTAVPSSSL